MPQAADEEETRIRRIHTDEHGSVALRAGVAPAAAFSKPALRSRSVPEITSALDIN
jgi:hypothetical protein